MKHLLRWLKERYEYCCFIRQARVCGKCNIRRNTLIRNGNKITVKGSISLGESCKLLCWNEYSSSSNNQILAPLLEIGDNFRATRNLTIQCAGHTYIGNNVLVSSDVFIIDYNHCLDPRNINYLDGELEVKEVFIDDGVWIGNNVLILPGAKIGKKVIIGAGSVVTGAIDDYSIAVGNPARVIKRWDLSSNKWISVSE